MEQPNELNRLINAVVDAREKQAEATNLRGTSYLQWAAENQHLLDAQEKAKEFCHSTEDELRKLALQFYSDTGEKQVALGVGIRVRSVLNYEVKDAFAWALEHKFALELDKSAFEKMAKIAPETRPSFVTITEEPQATIATELAKVE